MNFHAKRIVSTLCALAMLAAMIPSAALADDTVTAPASPVVSTATPAPDAQEGPDLSTDDEEITPAPTETPAEVPEETPTATPTPEPTEEPADNSAEGPEETPTATPTATPVATPTAEPVETPTEGTEEAPAETPTEGPSQGLETPSSNSPLLEGAVAKVGDKEYASLDEAVKEAAEGSTIELLADCELGEGFNKTLTFTGKGKITINKQLKSNGEGWMCFGLGDPSRVLTFDGPGVEVEWNSDGSAPWLMLSLSGTLNVTNGASLTFQFDSRTTKTRNAIYMNDGATLNVTNGSTFQILAVGTQGTAGQGIQLDKTGKSYINVTGKSTFLIDGTNRGYVNSPAIYVEDSTFTVQNCTSNGSNGGHFEAVNSTVTYKNNAGHGLSAGNVILKNSTLTSDNNGLYGVYVNGEFLVDSTSELTVTNNSYDGDCAGLNLTAAVANGRVESGATVTITGNKCSGLSNRGVCVFEEGSSLTITDNYNDKGSSSYGGGIYNTKDTAHLTLPSDAVIYNNHAVTGADDIYNTGELTFSPVGSGWVLADCDHTINGWYDDSKDNRWNVDDAKKEIHAVKFDAFNNNRATITGEHSLKAAHDLFDVKIQPAEIIVYMGGDEGYEGVSSESGVLQGSHSLPEPGYYFELPEDVNNAFAAIGLEQPTDLSKYIKVDYSNPDDERHWTLEQYGATASSAYNKFIYRINGQSEEKPFRLNFTDESGNITYTEDDFNLENAGTLSPVYTMKIYNELVDDVIITVTVPAANSQPEKIFRCKMTPVDSKLNVRYVSGSQDSVVTGAVTDIKTASDREDPNQTALKNAYVVAGEDTKFYINGSTIDVTAEAAPSLLFDAIVSSEEAGTAVDYEQLLTDKAVEKTGVSFQNLESQAHYLDLVDANNGNVWLTSSKPVTVYWPYPDGTNADTTFYLVHFDGVDRDMSIDNIQNEINASTLEVMDLTTDEYGIRFETDSFSPYVLLWEDDVPDEPEEGGSNEETTPAATPVPTPAPTPIPSAQPVAAPVTTAAIPQTGDTLPVAPLAATTVIAGAALAVLAFLRKRRDR